MIRLQSRDAYHWLAGAIILAFGQTIGLLIGPSRPDPARLVHPLPSLDECYTRIVARTGLKEVAVADQDDIAALCERELQVQGLMNDFQLRRLGFFQQDYASHVTLWMVVIITLSGVLLAGIQLAASYSLAAAQATRADIQHRAQALAGAGTTNTTDPPGRDASATAIATDPFFGTGQFVLQKDRVVLSSSVIGIFILIVSFGFFLVYVYEIYSLKSFNPDAPAQSVQEGRQLASGGAGNLKPPSASGGEAPNASSSQTP